MHLFFPLVQCPYYTEGCCSEDDHNHIDIKHCIGDKRCGHQGNIHPRAGLQHLAAEVEYHIQNDRRYAGLHSLEQQSDVMIGGKGVVEHRNDRKNDHRGNDRSQHCHGHSHKPFYLPAYQNRSVYCDGARRGLRQSGHVQHFLLIDPMQLIHKFFLHKGHDDKTTAKGKAADVQCT